MATIHPHDDRPGREPHDDRPGREPHDDRPGREPHDDRRGRGPHDELERLAPYGFGPSHETLALCTTCMGLFDDPSLARRDFQLQKCRCHPEQEPCWPHYDYNERARLCDCCGRHVLRSGSRWSVWFCEACKERVVALNREFGLAVIPIGRHSLMHGFGLQPGVPGGADPARVKQFVERFKNLGDRMRLLNGVWKPAHLRAELERLGLLIPQGPRPAAIPLATYLGAVAEEDRTSGVDRRLLAFRGLTEFFRVGEARA